MPVSLNELLDTSLSDFLNLLAEAAGHDLLENIDYEVVGHAPGNIIHIAVSGDASDLLDEDDEEP